MKKKTKILTTLFIATILIFSFSIFAFANESTVSTAAEENLFTQLYGFACENSDKIFSFLAFIGALILSFAYKRGLFPFVERALKSLSSSVSNIRDAAEKTNSENSEFLTEIKNALAVSEKILKGFEDKLSELEEKISIAAMSSDKTEELRLVMLAEVEMIYDIFNTSSLPQYQKDKVGEAYLRMKKALTSKEE